MKDKGISCSFCSKPLDAIVWMIAGPKTYICNECIAVCCEIIFDKLRGMEFKKETEKATP